MIDKCECGRYASYYFNKIPLCDICMDDHLTFMLDEEVAVISKIKLPKFAKLFMYDIGGE